jgi:WD40 repeat protein
VKTAGSFTAHRGRVTALAYAEEDRVLVTGGTDGTVRLWDPGGAVCRGELDVGAGVVSLAVSPSGTRLVVGARRGGCSVWSYPEGARLAAMPNHRRPVSTVDVAPSGLIVVSGSYEGTVRLWEMEGCGEIDAVVNDRRRTAGAAFTPGGEYLVTNGFGGAVGVWTVPGLELLRAVQCHETAVYTPVFSPDGRLMATHGPDPWVRLWSTGEWEFAGQISLPHHGGLCLAFGADGSELFAASGSTVWSLDPRAGAVRRATTLDRARVQSLAVSSDGEDLAVGTRDGRVLRLSS